MNDLQRIRQQAESFLNYNGGGDDELLNFDGLTGDDLLNFNGNDSRAMLNEIHTERPYSMTLQHANLVGKTFLLLPGLAPDSVNVVSDGVTVTKDGAAANAAGYPGLIRTLQREIDKKPHNIIGVKIKSDSALIDDGYLKIITKSAFAENDDVKTIQFAHYKGDQFQDKTIFINTPFTVGDAVQLEVYLPANCSTTFSWFFGASLDTFQAMKKKNKKLNAMRGMAGVPMAAGLTAPSTGGGKLS